jgi:hypothetical protein
VIWGAPIGRKGVARLQRFISFIVICLQQGYADAQSLMKGDVSMADNKHRQPDHRVTSPVKGVWHGLSAAWKNEGGTINVILDVGVPPKDGEE